MRQFELRPVDRVGKFPPRFREVEILARAVRVSGITPIVAGTVLNAVGVVYFGAVAVLNVFCMALDDSGRTKFEAPVVLLYTVVPGAVMIVLGSLYAARTPRARLRLAVMAMAGSLVLGPFLVCLLTPALRFVGILGAAIA